MQYFNKLDKKKAVGIDNVTKEEYSRNLENQKGLSILNYIKDLR